MPARPLHPAHMPSPRRPRAPGASQAPRRWLAERVLLYEHAAPEWMTIGSAQSAEGAAAKALDASRGNDDMVTRVKAPDGRTAHYCYRGQPTDASRTTLNNIVQAFRAEQRRKPWHVEEIRIGDLARHGDWTFMGGADTRELALGKAAQKSMGLNSFVLRVVRQRDGEPVAHFIGGRSVRASQLEAQE
jgi:hypothetical protein